MRRFVVLVLMSAAALGTACNPAITLAPSQGVLHTLDAISAACAISTAWGGPSSATIPKLEPCSETSPPYKSLEAGSIVTTNSCGQAWLQVGGGCAKIYVFHTTKLVASTCGPGNLGSSGCLTSGTVAWSSSGCTNGLTLGTPSASIRLEGTWVAASYVEDRQVSLFVQLDGTGEAIPFLDPEARQVGDTVTLEANEFWFSAPGDAAPVLADVEGRIAQPLDRLPEVIRELGLESWYAEVFARAADDGFDVRDVVSIPTVQVRLAGGQLEDRAAREPVYAGFEWGPRADEQLPNGAADALVGLAADDPPVDLRTANFDPAFAQVAIKEQGGFGITVIWPKGDLEPYAGALVEALRLIGLDVLESPVGDDVAASEVFEAEVAADRPALWLALR